MRADRRLARLCEQLADGRILALSEAATVLDVSEMTVRRDVARSDGRLTVLGGHVVAGVANPAPYALAAEEDSHAAAKLAACEHALALIEREDTIFLDSGTTLAHLARRLPTDFGLTVVCFSMNIATILAGKDGIRWLMAGGLYTPPTASFSGEQGPAMIRSLRLTKAFISAGGLHPRLGASCADFSEVAIKRAAIESALASHLVVDSSKLGKVKLAYFARPHAFASIISEDGPATLDAVDAEDAAAPG